VTRRVALTGGIATGKSYVRARFEELGVQTIDSDVLAREAVQPGSAGFAAVIARFGPDILDTSGTLDRRKLAGVVFSNAEARRDLEQIIHPYVRAATEAWFASVDASRHPFAIADIPLLYETGRDADFDAVIVVACDPGTQLQRVIDRDKLTEAEARSRIAAQLPIEEKISRADHVIRSDGSFSDTDAQVREVYQQLVGG
jgi:dephospho-CoA kinase